MSGFIDKREIEQLSIVDYLSRLGIFFKYKSGPEYFYHSMLRDDDQSPSFSVNDAKGVWMDRGNADPAKRGGTIIHLAQLLFPALGFYEILQRIRDTFEGASFEPPLTYVPHQRDQRLPEDEEYQFELWEVRPIGSYFPITRYLESRGLLELAEGRLSEVYYRNRKKPGAGQFFAAGWQNEHGNWEFSGANGFKSTIGKKGLTVIPGSGTHAQVFEGYFDYLSRLQYAIEPDLRPTVIVLNSISFTGAAIDRLRTFEAVDLFCDNDEPGQRCTETFLAALPQAADWAYEYAAFKDYNQKLQADLGLIEAHHIPSPTRIGR